MHARERILTNGSFKDGIEIQMTWIVTTFSNRVRSWLDQCFSFHCSMKVIVSDYLDRRPRKCHDRRARERGGQNSDSQQSSVGHLQLAKTFKEIGH